MSSSNGFYFHPHPTGEKRVAGLDLKAEVEHDRGSASDGCNKSWLRQLQCAA